MILFAESTFAVGCDAVGFVVAGATPTGGDTGLAVPGVSFFIAGCDVVGFGVTAVTVG